MMLKIVPMIMKNQRPTIAWRIWSAARFSLIARNFAIEFVLLAEGLGQQHARHAERLLGRRAHLGQGLLRLGRDLPADLADAVGQVQEERQQAERQQGQLPAQQEHRDDRADGDRQVAGDRSSPCR